jgi:hypothetical protein
MPSARSMTRDEYEHTIFGNMLGSDTVMSNDESADTVENDEQSVPLAETTSMLSDDCICHYRHTYTAYQVMMLGTLASSDSISCGHARHHSRHCRCNRCSEGN